MRTIPNPERPCSTPFSLLSAVLAGCGLILSSEASASPSLCVNHVTAMPEVRAPWNKYFTVPQFNPALGTLTGIDIEIRSDVRDVFAFENREAVSRTITVRGDVTYQIRLPSTAVLFSAGAATLSHSADLSAYDGVTDFGGTSGTSITKETSFVQVNSWDASDPAIAGFIGSGDITLRFLAFGAKTITGGSDVADNTILKANGAITVTYCYVPPLGSIGDFVWHDINGDGVQDPTEPPLPGLNVALADSSGNPIPGVPPTTTDSTGFYSFVNLPAGEYKVIVTPPAGYVQTYDLDGLATPHMATASLAAGQNRTDVDFGYQQQTSSLGDRVWADIDGNGVQDPGEPGIPGVTVALFNSAGTQIGTDVTDADGYYGFDGLPSGTYKVSVSGLPAGYVQTYDLDGTATPDMATAALGVNESRLDVDFGYQPRLSSVGDYVWCDKNRDGVQDSTEPPLPGIKVRLLNSGGTEIGSTTTGTMGEYLFEGLPAGSYAIAVDAPVGYLQTYDLDGIVSADVAQFTLGVAEARRDVDFGYVRGNLGDRVWNDLNGDGVQDPGEPGISGAVVKIVGPGGFEDSTTTDGNGFYSFGNLPPGDYTVTVMVSAGFEQTYDLDGLATPHTATAPLAAGESRLDVDFGYQQRDACLGDRVWSDLNGDGVQDSGELGIPGVLVTLYNSAGTAIGTATTDNNGFYQFCGLPAGSYKVCVGQPAGTIPTYDLDGLATPNCASASLAAGQKRDDVDFGYQALASIGDFVWLDTNRNGIQDADEPGVEGVKVELFDSSNNLKGTKFTTSTGFYCFTDLLPGSYFVRFTPVAGSAITLQDQGGNEAKDSDANPSTGDTALVTLAAGESNKDVDAGLYRLPVLASLGDRVWHDVNKDGIQAATGEPGIPGVTVELLDIGGNVVGTRTTDANGEYLFEALQPGTYSVRFIIPPGSGYVFSPANQGSNDAIDSDANTATGVTGAIVLAPGDANRSVDAGLYKPCSVTIGDFVWRDSNANGVQDSGEPGVQGVTVRLLNGSGTVLRTTVTDNNGFYLFTGGLPGGNYAVQFVLPDGYRFTTPYLGGNYLKDSDANTTSGKTKTYCLPDCYTKRHLDAGLVPVRKLLNICVYEANLLGGTRSHALWLPGIGTDFVFSPANGSFTESSDGKAKLVGTVYSRSNPNNGFSINVSLSGFTAVAPSGSPKLELPSSSYKVNGGPVDPSTWTYYTSFSGTLSGFGKYAGAVLNVTRTGPAFQVGVGANGKNHNMGASSWFNWTVAKQGTICTLPNGQGDFNLDFRDCTTPPCQTTGWNATYYKYYNQCWTPVVTRIDAMLNFDWGTGSPGSNIPSDNFAAVWTSTLTPAKTGNYQFHSVSDDGVRVTVNGKLIINNWTDHAPTENTGTVYLEAGKPVSIKVEYYENKGGAVMKLLWTPPGESKRLVEGSATCANRCW